MHNKAITTRFPIAANVAPVWFFGATTVFGFCQRPQSQLKLCPIAATAALHADEVRQHYNRFSNNRTNQSKPALLF
jgi:hypothetical protein